MANKCSREIFTITPPSSFQTSDLACTRCLSRLRWPTWAARLAPRTFSSGRHVTPVMQPPGVIHEVSQLELLRATEVASALSARTTPNDAASRTSCHLREAVLRVAPRRSSSHRPRAATFCVKTSLQEAGLCVQTPSSAHWHPLVQWARHTSSRWCPTLKVVRTLCNPNLSDKPTLMLKLYSNSAKTKSPNK